MQDYPNYECDVPHPNAVDYGNNGDDSCDRNRPIENLAAVAAGMNAFPPDVLSSEHGHHGHHENQPLHTHHPYQWDHSPGVPSTGY